MKKFTVESQHGTAQGTPLLSKKSFVSQETPLGSVQGTPLFGRKSFINQAEMIERLIQAEEAARVVTLVQDIVESYKKKLPQSLERSHAVNILTLSEKSAEAYDLLKYRKVLSVGSDPTSSAVIDHRSIHFSREMENNTRNTSSRNGRAKSGDHSGDMRPQTVNEIYIGDIFENIQGFELEIRLPFVRIIGVNAAKRTAVGEGENISLDINHVKTYAWAELLNQSKFRRVINSKPKTSFEMGFNFFLEENPPPPERLGVEMAYVGEDAREAFFHMSRRVKFDGGQLLDARRVFLQACQTRKLTPLPLIVRCIRDEGSMLDLTNQLVGCTYGGCIAEALVHMHFLKEVNLTCNKLDGITLCNIINSLSCLSLKTLILDKNKVSKLVTEKLTAVTGLVYLSLNECALNDTGVIVLMNVAKNLEALESLSLSDNKCTMMACPAIAAYLSTKQGCYLRSLNLSWNNLRTEGAVLVLNAITCQSLLKSLYLDWNGLNDSFLSKLDAFLKLSKNKSLTYLSVRNNMLSVSKLGKMLNNRPLLEISFSEITFPSRCEEWELRT